MEMLEYLPIDRLDDNIAVSPYEAFIGHPTKNGYGCYAPVIEKAINSYFEDINETSNIAKDISGATPEKLYKYVREGVPVIVWATMNMRKSYISTSWKMPDGNLFYWRSPLHCLVLIGYTKDTVILADPYSSMETVEYPKELFEERYNEMYKQSVVIVKKENH